MDWLAALVTLLTQGWPVAIIILAAIFRKQLVSGVEGILPRVRKAGPLEFDPVSQPQIPPPNVAPPPAGTAVVVDSIPSPTVSRVENDLWSWINQQEGPAQLHVLVRQLAVANLSVVFERIYGEIYGSQLAAIRKLNSQQLSTSDFRQFYDAGRTAFPAEYEQISFEKWARFLEQTGLVVRERGKVLISEYGREFITYLVQSGRSEFKAF